MVNEEEWRERYTRQLALSQIGDAGQRTLADSTVTVVGAGGLGSHSAELLVRMGVGHVRVIDGDVVELSNLHRVGLYGDEDIDRPKVEVLVERLGGWAKDADMDVHRTHLTPGNALDLLQGSDVVLDGLDNMPARYLLNDTCLELAVPWVYGGVIATGGLVAPFPAGGPCLRCLFPEPPEPGRLPTPETHGIHPALPSVVASIQVAYASRALVGDPGPPRLLALDLWSDDWRVVHIHQRADCPACARGVRYFLRGEDGD
jgi:adenylyltransferase/sulfurtransferase